MINALANHNFRPHNGLNISMDTLITALNDSINLASDATELVGGLALTAGNNVTFDLDDLDKHNSKLSPPYCFKFGPENC
jgi:hypothetical protein